MKVINGNFDENIKSGICVVDFFADWCGPCKMFANVFENVSKKFDDINFYKFNVDEDNETSNKYSVMSIPTIILFKDGSEVKRHIGFLDEDSFIQFLEDV